MKKEELRKKVIEEVDKVILEQGVTKISMRDIAKKVGVAVGTLYYHFHSKEYMILTTIHERKKVVYDEIIGIDNSDRTSTEKLQKIVEAIYDKTSIMRKHVIANKDIKISIAYMMEKDISKCIADTIPKFDKHSISDEMKEFISSFERMDKLSIKAIKKVVTNYYTEMGNNVDEIMIDIAIESAIKNIVLMALEGIYDKERVVQFNVNMIMHIPKVKE